MKYIVYQKKYNKQHIFFITSNFNKIKDLIKGDKFKFLEDSLYDKELTIEIIDENYNENNKNSIKYYVDLKNKCIMDKKTNEVKYNLNETLTENYNEKINKIQNLIKIAYDLPHKKVIPREINNYFEIIYKIDKRNNYSNIDEDIDYLEVIIEEMSAYPDKKN